MKTLIQMILYSVLGLILGAMVLLGTKAYTHAILYEEATTEMVSYQDAGQQASLKLEKFAKSLLGDLYDDELRMKLDKVREKQEAAMEKAKKYTFYFMSLLVVVLF
ncbi:MAG TPA: hypothetical protein VIN02_05635, partial [Sulfurovum sp.]